MPTKGTQNTPIRFTEEDKAKVEAIKAREGLPSFAAAVRHAVSRYHAMGPIIDEMVQKKTRKKISSGA